MLIKAPAESSRVKLDSPRFRAVEAGLIMLLTEKFITVRPTWTALLKPGRSGVLYLIKTKVPNLL